MMCPPLPRPRPRNVGTALAVVAALVGSGRDAPAAITLSNGTTSVQVNGGEANNGLVPFDGYFRYTDLATGEETSWSIDPLLVFPTGSTAVLSNGAAGGFGSPVNLGGGVVRSTAVTGGVTVQADTQLIGTNARTTFTFTTSGSLNGITFVFQAENDLFTFEDDTATFQGSIGGGNLQLFQFDSAAGGLTVRLTGEAGPGAALTLFGAGVWTGFGTALEAGNRGVLSATGSNFATTGDLGLALGFALSGTTATVVINYETQPQPPQPPTGAVPEPAGVALLAAGALGVLGYRRRKGA